MSAARGEWEGRTRAEIDEGWPGYLETGRRPAGYEPDDSVLDRVLAALEAIAAMHDGDVLVITHGGVVRVVERHLGGDAEGLIPNLGGLWLEHDGAGLRLGERVVLLDESQVTTPAATLTARPRRLPSVWAFRLRRASTSALADRVN